MTLQDANKCYITKIMHTEFVHMYAEKFLNITLCLFLWSLKQPSLHSAIFRFMHKMLTTLGKRPSLTISHASQQINELPKRERERFSGSNGKLKMANHYE